MATSTKAKWPIRVFPRRTTATPSDDGVRFGPPNIWDRKQGVDEVHISVIFTLDKDRAEQLAEVWREIAGKVKVDGPAYINAGGDFTPGLYLKPGDVITSRGCPNKCWFCRVWRTEGHEIRELEVKDGYNVRDNNLLACSREHIEAVFDMLERQPYKARFTGGLEAARLEHWHIERLLNLHPNTAWFSYDKAEEWEPLVRASEMFLQHRKNVPSWASCYVLMGWPKDTMEAADRRCEKVVELGFQPHAMLYDEGVHWREPEKSQWRNLKNEWNSQININKRKAELRKTGVSKHSYQRQQRSTVFKPFF